MGYENLRTQSSLSIAKFQQYKLLSQILILGLNSIMAREKKMKIKKGWVAVQVGLGDDDQDRYSSSFKRFVIPIPYLYNPVVQNLLDRASEIYGYRGTGPLTLPCSIEHFLRLMWRIETRGDGSNMWSRHQYVALDSFL